MKFMFSVTYLTHRFNGPSMTPGLLSDEVVVTLTKFHSIILFDRLVRFKNEGV